MKINLKNVREKKSMTAIELSERSGVTRQCIWMIENGKSNANMNTMKKLADALGVKVTDLFLE